MLSGKVMVGAYYDAGSMLPLFSGSGNTQGS